jgi:REP element-mobilizing transposase RayT
MDRWHNMYEDGCAFFCTATVSEWRSLMNQATIEVLYDTWEQCRTNNNVRVLGYCVMPNAHYSPYSAFDRQ